MVESITIDLTSKGPGEEIVWSAIEVSEYNDETIATNESSTFFSDTAGDCHEKGERPSL